AGPPPTQTATLRSTRCTPPPLAPALVGYAPALSVPRQDSPPDWIRRKSETLSSTRVNARARLSSTHSASAKVVSQKAIAHCDPSSRNIVRYCSQYVRTPVTSP